MTERVVLAYSGGLDTSVAIRRRAPDCGDTFDQSLAEGFVQPWGLPSRMAAARHARLGGGGQ
ncbi:hypothetical protein AB0B94_31385 [Micromonospora sp. NPDC048986]|uniref:hypothetical protein n=1 Tax=Micromonospora sp. NPDC048986 TaxID=3155644 RepID=UPI0033F96C6D